METLIARPYAGAQDRERIAAFAARYRAATCVSVYPTVWRLRLLLSSRVWEPARDVQIWEDTSGEVLGFALLWRRERDSADASLQWMLDPRCAASLAGPALEWARARARSLAAERGATVTLYANALDPRAQAGVDLEAHGFTPLPPKPDEYTVYMARPLQSLPPAPALAAGYMLRPLAPAEIDAYEALYEFAPVSREHRRELLQSDEYAHLVIANPGGELVAYCEASTCRAEWQYGAEHVGWIDYVGTREPWRGQGFGRAVLLAGLERLRAWGAATGMLVTVSTNSAALRLYAATGFTSVAGEGGAPYRQAVTGVSRQRVD